MQTSLQLLIMVMDLVEQYGKHGVLFLSLRNQSRFLVLVILLDDVNIISFLYAPIAYLL